MHIESDSLIAVQLILEGVPEDHHNQAIVRESNVILRRTESFLTHLHGSQ